MLENKPCACKKCGRDLPPDAVLCCYCGTRQAAKERTPKSRGNGQGSVYRSPSGKWVAAVTLGYAVEDGKLKRRTRTKTFNTRRDAIAAIPAMRLEAAVPKDVRLSELWHEFSHSRFFDELSKSQRAKLSIAWKRWKPLELRGIRSLSIADLEDTIEAQTSSYDPAHDMQVVLSHLYTIAVKKEIVQTNKTKDIDLPYDAPKAKRQVWTEDEVNAMWQDYLTHPFTAYFLIMCYAGLRFGELATIKLENIHLDQNYMIGGIKTEAGTNREIPIHKRIHPLIKQMMLGKKDLLLDANVRQFYAAYWEMVERTGIRKLPPHTCRHYFFSRMTAAGVQGGIIAEVGGHANYMITVQNYVRIPLESKLEAVNAI